MEKEILLVNANQVHSKKNGEDYYIVDYVDIQSNKNKSLVKNIKDMSEQIFQKFKKKVIPHNVSKIIGIFEPTEYDTIELVDCK